MALSAPFPPSNASSRFRGFIVLGPYRSGTSLTSLILSKLGANFGQSDDMHRGTRYNPGGYFERKDINDANDAYIFSSGANLADPGSPEDMMGKADVAHLRTLDLSWMEQTVTWAIKDPRMCGTLWSWLEQDIISCDNLAIVHVTRSLDAATRSGIKDPNIPDYCDGTEAGIRRMLKLYAELAAWHVEKLDLPTHHLSYEELIAEPKESIAKLAAFIGVTKKSAIRKATKAVGKKKGLFQFWLHRYAVLAPRKALRILFGKTKR